MRILHLTLKKGWFDMIACGEKREEYREIKEYWITRLCEPYELDYAEKDAYQIGEKQYVFTKTFNQIEFKNGYSRNARKMIIECHGISVGQPVYRWFGKRTEGIIFIIHLGNIISKNY